MEQFQCSTATFYYEGNQSCLLEDSVGLSLTSCVVHLATHYCSGKLFTRINFLIFWQFIARWVGLIFHFSFLLPVGWTENAPLP